jgi:hypothetical protein
VILGLGKLAAPHRAWGILRVAMPEESTTPDLVELSRRAVDAYDSGDLDDWMRFLSPDVVSRAVPLRRLDDTTERRGLRSLAGKRLLAATRCGRCISVNPGGCNGPPVTALWKPDACLRRSGGIWYSG